MKKHLITVLAVCSVLVILIVLISMNTVSASQRSIPSKLYELESSEGYSYSDTNLTSSFSYGRSGMGSLTISGDINQDSTFYSVAAYGTTGNICFSYSYDGAYQDGISENWNIVSESGSSFGGYDLGASIGTGVLIIQKSSDGYTYVNAVNPITNFFSSNPSGASDFYTTDGNDILQGTFYRVIVAYKMQITTSKGFLGIGKKQETKECIEVYDYYLCMNTGTISVHDLSVTASDFENEEYDLQVLLKGETLTNNATTTKGFSIDKLGTSYLVSVSKNGGTPVYVQDGQQFTENGKYTITTITKLGKKTTLCIYVFNGGNDRGYSTYFGTTFVSGKRIFRDSQFPVYSKVVTVSIISTESTIPNLRGTIKNIETGNVIEVQDSNDAKKFTLKEGTYLCDFYNGIDASGSIYHYTFNFTVSDESSGPYVNYKNLMSTQRFEDLQTKHYEVAYQTAGGGYIFVCFALDDYDGALKYAYEIEKRFIEKVEDGLYYKSVENPNLKVKYIGSGIELTEALNYYAALNVEVNYFNSTDTFTKNTYGNEMLETLESLSLRESIKVFASQKDRNKLINRQPFINNFTFVQAADFDCVTVEAFCKKNGKTYTLNFGEDVSSQLSVSSVYTITETNKYGEKNTYDVYFVNENTTYLDWKITKDGFTKEKRITNNDMVGGTIHITADSIEVVDIVNELDSDALIAIKAPDVYSFEIKCLLSEFEDLVLYKKGNYEIKVIDRLGNYFTIVLTLTGKTRFSELPPKTLCYTEAYNLVYLNDKLDTEEEKLDVSALVEALNRRVDPDNYSSNSYNNYVTVWKASKSVYDNVDATQKELTDAANALNEAYTLLEPITCRAELDVELLRFENIDQDYFTATSFKIYKSAYELAKKIASDGNSTNAQIEKTLSDLKLAYQSLVKRGNKTELLKELVHAQATDCYKYTPNSIQQLNSVFYRAYEIYSDIDALQSEIDSALNALLVAENQLVIMADFSSLEEQIQKVKLVDSANYDSSSIASLKILFDQAVDLVNDKNQSQSSISLMVEKMKNGIASLVPLGNPESLIKELKSVAKIDYFKYSVDQLTQLRIAYNKACEMISAGSSTQRQYDELTDTLRSLRYALLESSARSELLTLFSKVEALPLQNYKKESAQEIANAYADASKAIYAFHSSEDSIRMHIEKLSQTIKEAEKQ